MARELRVSLRLRDLFIERRELHAGEAAELTGVKYYTITRLFYALRQLGMIEFTREVISDKLLPYRYHRIVPGLEDDRRWEQYPISLLYPSCRLGAARYTKGTAQGRAEEYAKKD